MNNLTKNIILTPFNWIYKFSPEIVLKILFRIKQGYSLNLESPKTYNEKLQWIKLYDHNSLMPICCDKFTVREFVEQQGCGDILNHLIWEGVNPEDIPFDNLPEKFVVKVTHGSSFNSICTDKATIDRKDIIAKCKKWIKTKFLPCYGEWFYGVEEPRVIVEDYIDSGNNEQLIDYKVFCFHGEPRYVRVDSDRFTDHKMDVFDCEWNYISGAHMGYKCSEKKFERPKCLEKLMDYASKLSKSFYHARVDFYIVRDRLYFGEITFTNGAGFDRFSSYEFDLQLGNLLKLPVKRSMDESFGNRTK